MDFFLVFVYGFAFDFQSIEFKNRFFTKLNFVKRNKSLIEILLKIFYTGFILKKNKT
jgi:hypothetical protein